MEKEYLYKIGDTVRIRSDINRNTMYYMRSGPKSGNEPGTTKSMERYAGQIHTIIGYDCGYYQINDDSENLCWSDEMFMIEAPFLYKPGDIVTVLHNPPGTVDTIFRMLSGPNRGDVSCMNEYMRHAFAGEQMKITGYKSSFYSVEGNHFFWSDEMFEETYRECRCDSLL